MLYDTLIGPFVEFAFMRRALAGSFALALDAWPIGVFLMLRRMSLVGDAMAHAILPGFVIAVGAGIVARATELKEDASLAAFFLISLAVGVTIVSLKGTNVDLLHFLFGTVLEVQQVD